MTNGREGERLALEGTCHSHLVFALVARSLVHLDGVHLEHESGEQREHKDMAERNIRQEVECGAGEVA